MKRSQQEITIYRALAQLTIFGTVLLLIRGLITSKFWFYLDWNAFLAFIPLVCSDFLKNRNNNTHKSLVFFVGLIWLFFYPNAGYLVTDFIHFRIMSRTSLLDFFIFLDFAIIGVITAGVSMYQIYSTLKNLLKPYEVELTIVILCLLTGIGVFMGRELRFNSWDVVIHPAWLLMDFIFALHDVKTILFVLLTSFIHYVTFMISKKVLKTSHHHPIGISYRA